MTNKSPELERMVEASRRLQGPSGGARTRIGHALEHRIIAGATAAAVVGTAKVAAGATGKAGVLGALGSLSVFKIVVVSFVVAVGGVAAVRLAGRPKAVPVAPSHPARIAATTPTAIAPPALDLVPQSGAAPAPTAPVAARSGTVAAPASASPANLARELEIVRSAQRALESGDVSGALAQIDRYRREFPRGSLAHEAATVRVLALCGAGRTAEGLAAAGQLLREQPGSPFARRVRSACGVADPHTP